MSRATSNKHKYSRAEAMMHIIRDVAVVFASVVVAVAIGRSGIIHEIVNVLPSGSTIAIFVAGIFFTSMFTIAPAAIMLAELGQITGVWEAALIGALGSVVGDLLIFMFIRSNVTGDLKTVLKGKYFRKITRWSHFGFLRWIFPLVGALVIASPLPDELGLAMLGMSRVRTVFVIPIVFMMNVLGIAVLVMFGAGI